MLSEGKVGQVILQDGGQRELRIARTGEVITSDGHGRYFESVSRGKCFNASMQSGGALGTVLTASAVTTTLYNPLNSGINVSVIEIGVGITTVISTAAAGTADIVLAGCVTPTQAAPSSTTAAVVRNCLLGGPAGIAACYTIATLPTVPVVLRSLFSLAQNFATAASENFGITSYVDNTDGKIVLAPGTLITIQSIGTALSGIVSMIWEEVPLSS